MSALGRPPWEILAVALPLASATLSFLLRGRASGLIGRLTSVAVLIASVGVAARVLEEGPERYALAGWLAPLGIELYADGLSALLLFAVGSVGAFVSLYAEGYFPAKERQAARDHFWPLWFFLWAAMNALLLTADVFNAYVSLELLGLSAAALVALEGSGTALVATLRYLLVSFLASLAYLLGVALLYGAHGVLDMERLGEAMRPDAVMAAAAALMFPALALKTALFPLHFWLPPAHGNAPGPVSATLSGLVVKMTLSLSVRLLYRVFWKNEATPHVVGLVLAGLGGAAIVWGSVQALKQTRLKLLLACSTVAQLGIMFLLFAFAASSADRLTALYGGIVFAVSHAFAKAAAFLSASAVRKAVGHDEVERLAGRSHRLPLSLFAFGLAAVSLVGLPPSGGFLGKWLLFRAALGFFTPWLLALVEVGAPAGGRALPSSRDGTSSCTATRSRSSSSRSRRAFGCSPPSTPSATSKAHRTSAASSASSASA